MTTNPAKTGYVLTVPAHLIPPMYDEWGMDDIRDVRADGTVNAKRKVSGYDINDDNEISRILWSTTGQRDTSEYVTPHTDMRVWIPKLTPELFNELA